MWLLLVAVMGVVPPVKNVKPIWLGEVTHLHLLEGRPGPDFGANELFWGVKWLVPTVEECGARVEYCHRHLQAHREWCDGKFVQVTDGPYLDHNNGADGPMEE